MADIKAVSLSIFETNPYKYMLISHLRDAGIDIRDEDARNNSIFLFKVLLEWKCKIVHFHTIHHFIQGKKIELFPGFNKLYRPFKLFVFIFQILILRIFGTKIIWTVHEWADKFDGEWGEIHPRWAEMLGKVFHGIITHCNATKNEMLKALNLGDQAHKIIVIPHANYIGVYKNEVTQPKARTRLSIAEEQVVFLLFGNIYPSKGFLEAIEAFKHLNNEKTSLLVVGKPINKDLEALIYLSIKENDNIKFIPKRVADDDVQLYMNACDCVIVPYKVFTTSGVIILAMSFGKACIAPDVGYFNDVLDKSGAFLYDSTFNEGLFSAMREAVIEKECLAAMGKHNFKVASQWSWSYIAKETASFYQKNLSHN